MPATSLYLLHLYERSSVTFLRYCTLPLDQLRPHPLDLCPDHDALTVTRLQ